MKNSILISIFVLCLFFQKNFAQETPKSPEKYTAHNKGKFYFYWGGNRDDYTKSDIRFTGKDYDFTVQDVAAQDKPKGWHIDYINPARMTIPQTNFRMGYFINDHYNVSLGLDHMKYVMIQNQTVNMTGTISGNPPFDGTYTNDPTVMTEQFLTFEHTDGLNYVNAEISRMDDLSKFIGLPNTDKFQINLTEGIGGGFLYPKTNTMLMGKERHDDFHVSGYGISAKAGLNLTFFKYFFIQAELKGGYINMPDIRTTFDPADRASQDFMFLERVIAFGGIFRI
jgi:hypothetical protein